MKEKEIIDKLKELQNDSFEWSGGESLIDFIKKLQKENEELKKNQRYKKDFNGDKIFSLEYDKETLRDMLVEKQKEIKELKSNSITKDKIKEIIKEELPDDDICKSCGRYDVNGVVIKQKLIKLLEEE